MQTFVIKKIQATNNACNNHFQSERTRNLILENYELIFSFNDSFFLNCSNFTYINYTWIFSYIRSYSEMTSLQF